MADVNVKFGATLDDLLDAVKGAGLQIDGFKEKVAGVIDGVSRLAEIAATGFVGHEIFDFIESMAELGEQTQRTADIFGITTEDVGFLDYIAKVTGGSADGLTRSLERMATNLVDLGGKATPTGLAIEAMGLNLQSLQGMGLPELLDTLRLRFSELPPGLERTAIAQNLARNGAEELLPVLRMSSEEWDTLRQRFEATGAAMDATRAHTFDALSTSIDTFKTALTGLGERIMDALAPAIETALGAMTKFIESLNADGVRKALGDMVDGVLAVMNKVTEVVLGVDRIIENIIIHAQSVAKYGLQAFDQAHVNEMAQSIADMNTRIDGELAASEAQFAKWGAFVKNEINSVTGAVANSSGSPDDRDHGSSGAPQTGRGGGFKIYAPPVTDTQTGLDKITAANQKAADQAARSWQESVDKISSAISQQVMAVIRGNETIGQAIENLGLDALQSVVENAVKAITAYAGQAFGGVWAFLAPSMGPAAAGPAAAAQAAVMGAADLGLATGTWELPSDQRRQLHAGEMVVPAFPADKFRNAIDALEGSGSGGHTFNITANGVLDGRSFLTTFQKMLLDHPDLHNAILNRP